MVPVRATTAALVALLALGAGTAPALASHHSTAPATDGAVDQQGSPIACDYESLYDETIDAVVSIRTETALGSGFVYETDNGTAMIVTNAHVVGEADTVSVGFTRGEAVSATVVGSDEETDLAVVRVDESPGYVDSLPLSDTQPQQGTPVAALGNPLGFEGTITQGIVSGVNRSLPTQRGFSIPDVVQTDAAISVGNSGGPLVNCQQEVIGVNTAGIAAPGAENVGFAVSADVVRQVVRELIRTGEFAQPYLGVIVTDVTPPIAEANDLNETTGVAVLSVREDGPSAGVLRESTDVVPVDGQRAPVGGDVVVALDGRPVRTSEELSSLLLTEVRPGDEVTLTVVRDGERTNVTVTAEERPDPTSG